MTLTPTTTSLGCMQLVLTGNTVMEKRRSKTPRKASDSEGGENWHCVGTLAAAYAESGDFEKAKDWAAKAVELTKTDKAASDEDRSEARSRLELYKQGKPYREELKKK